MNVNCFQCEKEIPKDQATRYQFGKIMIIPEESFFCKDCEKMGNFVAEYIHKRVNAMFENNTKKL